MRVVLALLLVTYVTATQGYDCSYGESYWCSNLSIAKKCGAVQHCMDTVWKNTDLSNMKADDVCQYCEQFVADVKAQFNNQTQAQIEQFLNEACGLIPDQSLSDECKKQIDENVEQIFDMVRKSLDPKNVCSAIGLCQGFKDLVQHHKVNNDLHFVPLQKSARKAPRKSNGDVCADCKAFIGDLRAMIDSNATETQVIDHLKQMCHRLVLFTDNCDEFVEEFVPKYLDFMAEAVDPDTVCQAFQVCKGDKFILQKMRLRKTKMAQVEELQGGQICPICQMAFQELKTLISETTIQNDVENFIKKNLCTELGSYQKTCEEDVDMYGALFFQLVTSEVDPTTICTALGLCGQKKSVQNVRQGVECILCEFIWKEVNAAIAMNSTQEDMLKAVYEVCSNLPDTLSQDCKQFVDTYGKEVLSLLHQVLDPQTLCTKLEFCQASKMPTKSVQKVEQSTECILCEFIMKEVNDMIKENGTEQEIVKALENVCSQLPDTISQQCKQFVDTYGKAVIALLEQKLDPQAVCTTIGLCQASKMPKKRVLNVRQSAECVLCEYIAKELDQMIRENSTEEEIIKAVEQVCSLLPSTLSQECKQFIDTYGKAVIIILGETLDPKTVCTTLGLCQSATMLAKPTKPVGQGELCVVCETAVQYLDSLLEEKTTQAEIEAELDKVCNFLPKNIQQECTDMVKQYGPMIIQMIVQGLKPAEVCAELKLCTSIRLPVIEPMITPQKAQLVGLNECTYGPAYWCLNYENAKKCKATSHCRKHVWRNGFPKV